MKLTTGVAAAKGTNLRASVLLCVSLAACGGGDAPPTANVPPTVPVTTPPATTPTVVVPDPLPGAASCARLGQGRDGKCSRESSGFLGDVQAAVDDVIREQPQIFQNASLGLRVVSTGQFYVALIQKLDQAGICAAFDGEEVGVKTSDGFNEQFHMVTSDGILRRGESSYRSTCVPASFPGPARPYAPRNGCALPSSQDITCGRESAAFLADVESSIQLVISEHPEIFDLGKEAGPGWYRILDTPRYDSGVVDALKAKGYCARHDGEELVVKRENRASEHYDTSTGEGFVRRGAGSYRSTCYPAAF